MENDRKIRNPTTMEQTTRISQEETAPPVMYNLYRSKNMSAVSFS